MQLTNITIAPVNDGKLKAFVNIAFDGEFIVRGIKVIERNDGGLFVAMPARKATDGTWKDMAHPLTAEFRKMLSERVLNEYEKQKGKLEEPGGF